MPDLTKLPPELEKFRNELITDFRIPKTDAILITARVLRLLNEKP